MDRGEWLCCSQPQGNPIRKDTVLAIYSNIVNGRVICNDRQIANKLKDLTGRESAGG